MTEEGLYRLGFAEGGGRGCGVTFSDPGPLPESLTHVPGFVEDLTDYTLRTGSSPNRVLAFAGALTFLAHISGRSCTDTHGTHTNLYMVVLGESGIGKDAPRKVNMRLADRVGFGQTIVETFASGEAIEDALLPCPCLLLQADEVETFFGNMRGAGRVQKAMSERMRRLFTSSSSIYTVRRKAGAAASGAQIMFPHLCVFGTGVPSEFLDSLTAKEITNGLFGRCLILRADDQYVAQPAQANVALPRSVVRRAELLARRELDAMSSGVIGLPPIKETPEAAALLNASAQVFMQARKCLAERDLPNARATVVRVNEKIAKLALLWAVSENPKEPLINRAAVEWAVHFATYVTQWMLFEGQFHVSEGRFGTLKDRAVKCFGRFGGSVDRRTLLRSLGCDAETLNRIIRTLILAEVIDGPEEVDGKIQYSLRNG